IVSKLFQLSTPLSVGIMTGALTSTPGLAAAIQATKDPIASVGYGIAYPFAVLAVVLFVQLLPRILNIDLKKDFEETNHPIRHKQSPEVATVVVTNPVLNKKTLKELAFHKKSVVISRIIRNGHTNIALSDSVILTGDELVAVGEKSELETFASYVGNKIEKPLENRDNIQLRKITVESEDGVGRSIQKLKLRGHYGTTVTRIVRNGIELNQDPNMPLIPGDVLTVVSTADRLNEIERLFTKKSLPVTNVHIFSIALTLLIGVLVGMIPFPIPGAGTITLGIAGGPLFVALIIGHFGKIGPIHVRYYEPANRVIQELGLALFLAGAGTTAGQGLVEVIQTEGFKLVLSGAIITIMPIIAGYFLAKKMFKLSTIHSLGALCGGMTSTPALGALKQVYKGDEPAIAYAAAYPFSLIFVSIASQVIVLFL